MEQVKAQGTNVLVPSFDLSYSRQHIILLVSVFWLLGSEQESACIRFEKVCAVVMAFQCSL
jgi:hypothetical protein